MTPPPAPPTPPNPQIKMKYHNTPVEEFHTAFGHPVNVEPTVPNAATRLLRVKLIAEELTELAKASGVYVSITPDPAMEDLHAVQVLINPASPPDLIEVADALGDLRYVVDGANLVYGLPGQGVFEEIHRSNMSKLGADGKPIYREDGKILKGPNFTLPDIPGTVYKALKGVPGRNIERLE